MGVRGAAIKKDCTFAQSPGFDLNSRENVVALDDEVVPVIFTERNRDVVTRLYKFRNHDRLGNVADPFRITLNTRFVHTIEA